VFSYTIETNGAVKDRWWLPSLYSELHS